jgi:ribosome-associated translation inhibitor RaiA
MKLTLQHFDIRSTDALDTFVEERIFALQPRLQIDEASVRLERHRGSSPAFRVQVHLVTPGPDVLAEGRDHTIRAALGKVLTELELKISGRALRRVRRLQGNLQSRAASRAPRARSRTAATS